MRLGIYQHSKTGNLYKLLGIAKHSETLEDMVIYECLYNNPKSKIWVRPKKMFFGKIVLEGKTVQRFKFIKK